MREKGISRRDFMGKVAAGVGGLMAVPHLSQAAAALPVRRSATDQVVLGKSGIRVSRLGFGTGSNGGSVQRALGQDEFTRLVHAALDRGVTFFDTANNYREMHEMLGKALKGVDRDKIQIQSKIPWNRYEDPLKEIDRFRTECQTDYFDSFLIHCVTTGDWPEEQVRLMDLLDTAKERQVIRSHGVSAHGLDPLESMTRVPWIQVGLVRVNHNGHHMDGATGAWAEEGDRNAALPHIKKLHEEGTGIIGMKLIGNGDFTDPEVRRKSIHFVMGLDYVDAVIMGFKSPAEIDEAIKNMNDGLNS
jgi:1-deoxyxylulose-5-phosphate synthase